MAEQTPIEWSDSSCNGQMGCDGCELWKPGQGGSCYAGVDVTKKAGSNSGMPSDFGKPEIYPYRIIEACGWASLAGKKRPNKPWLDGLPRMIFLDDYGDTFTRSLDDAAYVRSLYQKAKRGKGPKAMSSQRCLAMFSTVVQAVECGGHWLDRFVPMMAASPHVWQILTKRPARMKRFDDQLAFDLPRNFWPMTSITRPGQLGRVRHLRATGIAKIRGISYEPIIEPVDFSGQLDGISWVIVGGESGRDARPCRLEWIDRVVDPAATLASTSRPIAYQCQGHGNGPKNLILESFETTEPKRAIAAPRRLTPGECEKLMGLPGNWTRYRADGSEIADGPRYRMIGNGAAVPHVTWIGRRLARAINKATS